MNDTQLIQKIQLLKQIQPEKGWAVLLKSRLIGQIGQIRPIGLMGQIRPIWQIWTPRFALASLAILLGLASSIDLARTALPGDLLYPIKKLTEKTQLIFVSARDLPKIQLETANRRLEEVSQTAENNKNTESAVSEFKESVNLAAQSLKNFKDSPKLTKEIVGEVQKLADKKGKVEAMGVVVGESEELNQALSQMVEREIKDLESRSLTESQAQILIEAKNDFEKGNFSEALEEILRIGM